jgi:arylsulfatase
MKERRVSYVHNWVGLERYTITAPEPLAPGKATIRYEFVYDGGERPGAGGTGTISVNGQVVAEGRIGNTTPFLFSADETADVGTDGATPVTEEYAEGDNAFTGTIEKVTVELM